MATWSKNQGISYVSGSFLATQEGANSGIDQVNSALVAQGLDGGLTAFGGGFFGLPGIAGASGDFLLTRQMTDADVQSVFENALKNAFTFPGVVTKSLHAADTYGGADLIIDPSLGGAISDAGSFYEQKASDLGDIAQGDINKAMTTLIVGSLAIGLIAVAVIYGEHLFSKRLG